MYPERKYDRASYRNIAEVIWTEMGEAGIVEFLRRLVFNVLIGNADMHLKTVLSSTPTDDTPRSHPPMTSSRPSPISRTTIFALTFVDSKRFSSLTSEQFERFAAKARLPAKLTLDTVRETVRRFEEAWRRSTRQGSSTTPFAWPLRGTYRRYPSGGPQNGSRHDTLRTTTKQTTSRWQSERGNEREFTPNYRVLTRITGPTGGQDVLSSARRTACGRPAVPSQRHFY